MRYHWDFSFFLAHTDLILQGLANTLKLAITALLFGLIIGVVIGIARTSRSLIWRLVGTCYVEIFRNIPAMILIFWFFFAVPILTGIQNNRFLCAAVALTVYAGAYLAEIYRSGIQSIERGQWEAARALGFGRLQQLRYIVLPQAIKRMIPAFTNEAIEIVKLTAIAATIAYAELLYDAKLLSDMEYRPVEAYTGIAVIFTGMLFLLGLGSRWVERKMSASD
jgi:polar amino acid transport system permease protein